MLSALTRPVVHREEHDHLSILRPRAVPALITIALLVCAIPAVPPLVASFVCLPYPDPRATLLSMTDRIIGGRGVTYQKVDPDFYLARDAATRPSAEAIVSLLLELYRPTSAVDLGCGVGTWLSVLSERGVGEIYGIETDEVPPEVLRIPRECLGRADLAKPIVLPRTFDLALSLEVAEHLPAHAAPSFVESLVKLAPVVLFSAAIPGQGGIHHVNEQWPEYWRALFAGHGYVMIDVIRRQILMKKEVRVWYRQNVVLFAREEMLGLHPGLRQGFDQTRTALSDVVHPNMFLERMSDHERLLAEAFGVRRTRISCGRTRSSRSPS